ncbi:uncharacterized protein [Cebidichthys violaceus]|uniref:uncharacterized protein n=1 Tax=Cebidichthys violaceus TaxID=271503 RepID=UPI0035CB392F
MQFGRYQGKIFHWLLENVVGYSINLVSSYQKERERAGSQSPLMANKDAFTRYSLAYPEFAEAVRLHQSFEEARVKPLQPGQEGQALVGFGDHKFETLQSLYEAEDSKKIRFVNYPRRKAPTPGTQMETAVQYIRSRDRQRTRASVAAAVVVSSSTTTAAVDATTSTTGPPAAAPPPASPAAAAQSLSRPQAREPRVHRVLLLPLQTRSEEPSDAELVKVVVDLEKCK